MQRRWSAPIAVAAILAWGVPASGQGQVADDTRKQLESSLKEELGNPLPLHFKGNSVVSQCPNGRPLRLALPDLAAEEVGEEAIEEASTLLVRLCKVKALDPETAAIIAKEEQATAQLLEKVRTKKGHPPEREGLHPALLAMDATGGLLMLVGLIWGLVVVRGVRARRRPQPPPPDDMSSFEDIEVEFDETASLRPGVADTPVSQPGVKPALQLPEDLPAPGPAVESDSGELFPLDGEPLEDDWHAAGFDDAATVMVTDQEVVAEVQATVAAWQHERSGEQAAAVSRPASPFEQVAATGPVPTSDRAAAPAAAARAAPKPAAPAPDTAAPPVPPMPAPAPATVEAASPDAAAPDAGDQPQRCYMFFGQDPRPHIAQAAGAAVEQVRKKLFDGSLQVEIMSGEDQGEIAVASEWPDRHPVTSEECISYWVVTYSELMWRPIAGGRFRTMHRESALEANAKHPWLLLLELPPGQKFHQALLASLVAVILEATGGVAAAAVPAEQVDRDWIEMASEGED